MPAGRLHASHRYADRAGCLASVMFVERISQGSENFDTLPLQGGRGAMAALARCLADRWSEAAGQRPAPPPEEPSPAGVAI